MYSPWIQVLQRVPQWHNSEAALGATQESRIRRTGKVYWQPIMWNFRRLSWQSGHRSKYILSVSFTSSILILLLRRGLQSRRIVIENKCIDDDINERIESYRFAEYFGLDETGKMTKTDKITLQIALKNGHIARSSQFHENWMRQCTVLCLAAYPLAVPNVTCLLQTLVVPCKGSSIVYRHRIIFVSIQERYQRRKTTLFWLYKMFVYSLHTSCQVVKT